MKSPIKYWLFFLASVLAISAEAYVTVPETDSDGTFNMTLTAPSPIYYQVEVQRRRLGGVWEVLGRFFPGAHSQTLISGTYEYQARGYGMGSYGAFYSDWGVIDSIIVSGVPATVASLSSSESPSYDGTYRLSWTAPSTGADRYEWQERKDSAAWPSTWNNAGTGLFSDRANSAVGSYSFQVRACNTAGCGSTRTLNVQVTPPAMPATFSSNKSISYDGAFTVSWGSSPGAARYEWRQKLSTTSTWPSSFTSAGLATSLALTRTNGTYNFQLRACSAVGCSAEQNLTVTVDANSAPTLSASATTSTTGIYSLSYTAGRINGQVPQTWIYEGTTAMPVNTRLATGGVHTSVSSLALTKTAQGVWSYQTRSCVNVSYQTGGIPVAGTGTCLSSSIQNVTYDIPTPPAPAITLSGRENTYDTNGSFTVTWTAPSTHTTYYVVRRTLSGSTTTDNNFTATSRLFSGMADGVHTVNVSACNKFNECSTPASAQTSVQVMLTPGNPGTPQLDRKIAFDSAYSLSWGASSSARRVTHYEIQERVNGGASWSSAGNSTSTRLAFSNKANGSYDYSVRACNEGSCSARVYTATPVSVINGIPVTNTYTYDALGRLKKVEVNGAQKTRYDYDAAGNRQSVEE